MQYLILFLGAFYLGSLSVFAGETEEMKKVEAMLAKVQPLTKTGEVLGYEDPCLKFPIQLRKHIDSYLPRTPSPGVVQSHPEVVTAILDAIYRCRRTPEQIVKLDESGGKRILGPTGAFSVLIAHVDLSKLESKQKQQLLSILSDSRTTNELKLAILFSTVASTDPDLQKYHAEDFQVTPEDAEAIQVLTALSESKDKNVSLHAKELLEKLKE
jgi:hypothetical protein